MSEMNQLETPEVETKPKKRHMGIKAQRAISNTIIHIILVVMSVVWLVPFVCTVSHILS